MKNYKIAVAGTGYVGLSIAISGYFWGMKLNRSCTRQTLMDKIKKLILASIILVQRRKINWR